MAGAAVAAITGVCMLRIERSVNRTSRGGTVLIQERTPAGDSRSVNAVCSDA